MSEREILALVVVGLFVLRWLEFFLLKKRGPRGQITARWTTIATLLVGSAFWIGSASEVLAWTFPPFWILTAAGGFLYFVRFALKAWAVRTLGKAWSTEIEIDSDHKLIRQGPYRWIRHPIYLCNLLEPVAVAMIANALVAGIVGPLLMWPVLFVRLYREESALLDKFGGDYELYRRQVRALIPLPRSSHSG